MSDNNNLKETQPKFQVQGPDYTQGQNLNQNQFNSMFVNDIDTTSDSTDEEDFREIPPKKILLSCQRPTLQDLATFNIRNNSQNTATSAEPYAVVASTSTAQINANQEVGDIAANLLLMNESGGHTSTNNHFTNNGNDNYQQQRKLKESVSSYSPSPTTSTSTGTSSPCLSDPIPPAHALAMLKMDDTVLYIKDRITIVGRNSTTSKVHFHVPESSFVSRKHFQILFDPDCGEFFLTCGSKNGIFVDDELQRSTSPPLKLPQSCVFRFPSTELLIHFENYVFKNPSRPLPDFNLLVPVKIEQQPEETFNIQHPADFINGDPIPSCSSAVTDGSVMLKKRIRGDQSNEVYSSLKISIPNLEAHSNPYPSPTGTISAANSCPASPRHNFPDYQTFYGNGNNRNNDDAFRPPSTSSYNEAEKPPYSYAQLIIQSISSAPEKQLTLSGIYTFISKNYPYYRMEANKGWQNSIRHNLSLNRYFIKVARTQDEPGKGSFWRIDPNSEAKLIDSSFKTRRQRSVVNFKRPFQGMPHSAPVSPSQRDMSRENSPLQDLSLQSAPGSPEMSIVKEEEAFDDQQSTEELDCAQSTGDQYK